jgi:hypothetical protein
MMTTQTCISARIIGNARVGGMLPYTVYRIEIADSHLQEKWIIYRRFSNFLSFYYTLTEEIGEHVLFSHHIPVPQKELGGSIGGNRHQIVQKRHRELQIYLNALLSIDNIDESIHFKSFIDSTYKGSSLCQIEFGQAMIRKESFVKVKRTKYSLIWGNVYIILLRDYRLFILRSISDASAQALACVVLTNEDVFVRGLSKRMIELQRQDAESRILIQCSSDEDYEIWLKLMLQVKVKGNYGPDSPSIVTSSTAKSSGTRSSATIATRSGQYSTNIFANSHIHGGGSESDETSALHSI